MSPGKILKSHFEKLKKENAKFSLRALAVKMDVSHTFLSKILNDKAAVPVNLVDSLIEKLKIDEYDARNLKKAVLSEKSGYSADELKNIVPEFKKAETEDYAQMPDGHIHLMRKWWNFAIMDLLTCTVNHKFTVDLIAVYLPVDKSEIENSLKELEKLGLIKKEKDHYVKTTEKVRFATRGPHPATREFYKQGMALASAQLGKTTQKDFDKRLIMGFSCAVNSQNIPKAKQRLAAALRECAEILTEGPCDDVFFVQGQIFSVLK